MSDFFSPALLAELPIVGILRGFDLAQLEPILESVHSGGLKNVEITMNSPAAADQIRHAVRVANGRLNVGAGTVTTPDLLARALDAGASFIVTPHGIPEVIESCVARGIPVFPGALSPGEIFRAAELGARCIKIFPADTRGPEYIRSLRHCFPEISLMPTGGIDLDTLHAFVEAGASAFGIGSPLFNKSRIDNGDWRWLESRARAFATQYRAHAQTQAPQISNA